MSRVEWVPVEAGTYYAIYAGCKDKLVVHSSFTNIESNSQFGEPRIVTQWGFKAADYPLIKYDKRGDEAASYFIACVRDDQ